MANTSSKTLHLARPRWPKAQKDFVRDNAHRLHDAAIAAILSRLLNKLITRQQVREARRTMGIVKAKGRGKCEVIRYRNDRSGVGLVVVGEAPTPVRE